MEHFRPILMEDGCGDASPRRCRRLAIALTDEARGLLRVDPSAQVFDGRTLAIEYHHDFELYRLERMARIREPRKRALPFRPPARWRSMLRQV